MFNAVVGEIADEDDRNTEFNCEEVCAISNQCIHRFQCLGVMSFNMQMVR